MTLDEIKQLAHSSSDNVHPVFTDDTETILARAVLAVLPVVQAALIWRHGVVDVGDGYLVDSDDGSAEPGMMRKPMRNDLVAAIDAMRAEMEKW